MPRRSKGKHKGRFKLPKYSTPTQSNKPLPPNLDMEQSNNIPRALPYIWKVLLYIALFIATTVLGEKGLSMLSGIPSKAVFCLVLFTLCVYIGFGIWGLTGWLSKWRIFKTYKRRMLSIGLVIITLIILPPTYTFINYFIKDLSSIEMAEFGHDSTEVLVHYGEKINEWMLIKTTIGNLKEQPRAPLTINGQDILYTYIEDKKLYVDLVLFGGYSSEAFFNFPLARTSEFSISTSSYINTEAGPNKNIFRESPGGFIADNITTKEIAERVLAPPIVIKTNYIVGDLPDGWKDYNTSTLREIRNEYDIPVLVYEYRSPYEVTISGIFLTSFGIVKVDNSEDVVFQAGSNLSDLGTYTVNNAFVHSFIDLFISEKSYNLYEDYSEKGLFDTLLNFFKKLFKIPTHEIKNLVINTTQFPATDTTPYGLLIEFGRRWDDIDPISISVNVSGARIDGQYAWWATPNLTGFNLEEIIGFRKGVEKDAFAGSANINPPIFTYYSLGKPLTSSNSLYLWFVSDKPLNAESIVFQGAYFCREENELILDWSKIK